MGVTEVFSARREPTARNLSDEWPLALYVTLKAASVSHVSYVPDAGHSTLISLFGEDPQVVSNVLTTEECVFRVIVSTDFSAS